MGDAQYCEDVLCSICADSQAKLWLGDIERNLLPRADHLSLRSGQRPSWCEDSSRQRQILSQRDALGNELLVQDLRFWQFESQKVEAVRQPAGQLVPH